jgi:hypothetical protein
MLIINGWADENQKCPRIMGGPIFTFLIINGWADMSPSHYRWVGRYSMGGPKFTFLIIDGWADIRLSHYQWVGRHESVSLSMGGPT